MCIVSYFEKKKNCNIVNSDFSEKHVLNVYVLISKDPNNIVLWSNLNIVHTIYR